MRDLTKVRKEYEVAQLSFESAASDPFAQFSAWYEDIEKIATVSEPNAMLVCTVDQNSRPSARILLLKGFSHTGFLFFSNYNSQKGSELANNNNATMVFYWPELERQVRIEGTVHKTEAHVSDQYFYARPIGSQVSAIVSPQSQIVDRRGLELAHTELLAQAEQDESILKRPNNWGGYNLVPERFEFWQGRTNRLHDRIQYHLDEKAWKKECLAP
jgi:pyridoxamine 5'-phosphate oxidase